MWDARVLALAGRQFNRTARGQLLELGMSPEAIDRRARSGLLVPVEDGVYGITPVLAHDEWGRWMGATLTTVDSALSIASAASAYGFWSLPRPHETITRPGSGGPRRFGGVVVHRSTTLEGERTTLRGIPITTAPRTLLDLARGVSDRALARSVREAVRLETITIPELAEFLEQVRVRRGSKRLTRAVARYSGLPLERARSGAEVRAMEILRAANRPLPLLNVRIAGEEADLSWPRERLIVEIDGGPFHLDQGEDARKERAWAAAGWTVRRIPSGAVYEHPAQLLARAPTAANVRLGGA